jgi:hypothetical protein
MCGSAQLISVGWSAAFVPPFYADLPTVTYTYEPGTHTTLLNLPDVSPWEPDVAGGVYLSFIQAGGEADYGSAVAVMAVQQSAYVHRGATVKGLLRAARALTRPLTVAPLVGRGDADLRCAVIKQGSD